MIVLPKPVETYLLGWFTDRHEVAYIHLEKNGSIVSAKGNFKAMGLPVMRPGTVAAEHLPSLVGAVPLEDDSLFLPMIRMNDQCVVDTHIIRDGQQHFVVFVDRRREENRWAGFQQRANDLSLFHEQERRKQRGSPSRIAQQPMSCATTGEKSQHLKKVSILALRLRYHNHMDNALGLPIIIDMLDHEMTRAAHAVTSNSGILLYKRSDTLAAVFGLTYSSDSTADNAITAARLIQKKGALYETATSADALHTAVGIASGNARIYTTRTRHGVKPCVLGAVFHLAEQMALSATDGQVLIDDITYDKSLLHKQAFSPDGPESLPVKNTILYAWEVAS